MRKGIFAMQKTINGRLLLLAMRVMNLYICIGNTMVSSAIWEKHAQVEKIALLLANQN
jgi:hypothetical protein